MKKLVMAVGVLIALSLSVSTDWATAQESGDAPAEQPVAGNGDDGGNGDGDGESVSGGGISPVRVILRGGFWSVVLWLALLGALVLTVYYVVDCGISVRASRIMPQALIDNVTEAMEQGDVLKALDSCEQEPGPMANILSAGFGHVEEGFEVIQDSITTAADLESEQLMQKISYLSVIGNLAPMLGLLGTVQGMIAAFKTLATQTGATKTDLLALDISQALWTTATGLSIAVPAVACFFIFRNKANRITLKMEAITIDLIKDLRNVEVVEEE